MLPYFSYLLASYLKVHFDDTFEHRKNVIGRNHGWTANGECMIDFTGFQFKISIETKELLQKKPKEITRIQLIEIAKPHEGDFQVFSIRGEPDY